MKFLWLMFVAMLTWGQSPTPYHIGGGVSPPTVVSKSEPVYSDEAREAKLQGAVVLHLTVDEDGSAKDITVDRRLGLGLGLEERAVDSVRGWKFKPGEKEGKPVPVLATVEVSFRLTKLKLRLSRAAFDVPQNGTRPKLVRAVYPSSALTSGRGLTLLFDVDEHGMPDNIRAEKPDGSKDEADMIAAMRDWRFIPGSKNGVVARIPATFLFTARDVYTE
jgi:TonB family protein